MHNFKKLFEAKDITKEVQKRLKKDGEVMLINPDEILVSFTDYDDGSFIGIDQFDNDVETETLKGYRLDESLKEATQSGDLLGELSDAMMACEKAMKRDESSLLAKFVKESKKAFETYEKYDENENGKDY